MRNLVWSLVLALCALCVCAVSAQEMKVENFARLKKPFLQPKTFTTDKKQAVLDLFTSEKGFTFKANGNAEVTADEQDDHISLLLPHKTRFIQISHPQFGVLTWAVPPKTKVLEKKKHYTCDLITNSPEKAYNNDKQWAVFYIEPKNAILYIDSLMYSVRDGMKQAYLPLGNHACRVEAPFHQMWEGDVCIYDSVRANVNVRLNPQYSYLTVKTPFAGCSILLDGNKIGEHNAVSNKLAAGRYRLTVVEDDICYYNGWVEVKPAEKKVVSIAKEDMKPMVIPENMTVAQFVELPADQDSIADAETMALVHIIAPDSTADILMNREKIGVGSWDGVLPLGFYAINTKSEGKESATYYLWVTNSWEQTVNLATPQSAYGMLNVRSNVLDAEILVNNMEAGTTPAIVRNLPGNRIYQVTVRKRGYKEKTITIYVRGNEMTYLTIDMKPQK